MGASSAGEPSRRLGLGGARWPTIEGDPPLVLVPIGSLEQQLRLWSESALSTAAERILQVTAETRRRPAIAEASLRRTLLAICMMAAAH